MFRVVFLAFFGAEPKHAPAAHARRTPITVMARRMTRRAIMSMPLWILAAISVVIGVYFTLHHGEMEFEAPGWLTPVAVSVAARRHPARVADLPAARDQTRTTLAAAFGPIRRAALAKFWIDDVVPGWSTGRVCWRSRG